jgi:hypothetical protein
MLCELLEICIETGTRVLAPTKLLYYDRILAAKLRLTDSVIGYSIFCDKLEPGPCNWGFDTDFRLDCARRYAEDDVDVWLKITMDCTQSFDKLHRLGMPIYKILDFIDKYPKIVPQLIPLRVHKKDVAKIATGYSKIELRTGIQNLFKNSIESARYISYHGMYIPRILHGDFENYFGNRICGKIGDTFYCDSCGMRENFWKINMNSVNILPVKMTKKKRWQKEWKDKNQLSFMEDLK